MIKDFFFKTFDGMFMLLIFKRMNLTLILAVESENISILINDVCNVFLILLNISVVELKYISTLQPVVVYAHEY